MCITVHTRVLIQNWSVFFITSLHLELLYVYNVSILYVL